LNVVVEKVTRNVLLLHYCAVVESEAGEIAIISNNPTTRRKLPLVLVGGYLNNFFSESDETQTNECTRQESIQSGGLRGARTVSRFTTNCWLSKKARSKK
jgi:hypothetical protein